MAKETRYVKERNMTIHKFWQLLFLPCIEASEPCIFHTTKLITDGKLSLRKPRSVCTAPVILIARLRNYFLMLSLIIIP